MRSPVQYLLSLIERRTCTSGSVVEYRLAKARVAGSNPVSCSLKYLEKPESKGFSFLFFLYFLVIFGDRRGVTILSPVSDEFVPSCTHLLP